MVKNIGKKDLEKNIGKKITLEKSKDIISGKLYGEIEPFNFLGFLNFGTPFSIFTDDKPYGKRFDLKNDDIVVINNQRYKISGIKYNSDA